MGLEIVEQGIVMPDPDYKLIRVGSKLDKLGRRMAIVDAADWDSVSSFEWKLSRSDSGNYYAYALIERRTVWMHRHVLGLGAFPHIVVDHKDGFGLNNRRYNLVPCTSEENVRTRKRWEIERNRRTRLWEVAVYSYDGTRSLVAAFETYTAAHHERYEKELYWKSWE